MKRKQLLHFFLLATLVAGLASCSTQKKKKKKGCDCPTWGVITSE